MSKKEFEDDDGRIVSDMTFLEKTTWYESFSALSNITKKEPKKQSLHEANIQLTKKETKSYVFSALLAGLSIALVFIGSFYLFILFCLNIWFK